MHKHWIWLTQRKGIGPVGCQKLLSAFGSAEQVYEMDREQYRTVEGFRKNWEESLMDKNLEEAEKVVQDCDRLGIRIITFQDRVYPERLKQIYDPPCVLYCKGELPRIDKEPVVAVVGTRRCSNYSLIICKQLATLIATSGAIVVSGGARGIDTMALTCALGGIAPVICVLAGGLDEYYPRENKGLFDRIAKNGCLLSEYPPGVKTYPTAFVGRNRLISGLSIATLVVEAPKGSGALTTADFALSQNRDVFTVYRPGGGKLTQGNEELINAGCEVVKDGWELLSRYVPQFPKTLIDGRTKEAMKKLYCKRYGGLFTVSAPALDPTGNQENTSVSEPMADCSEEEPLSVPETPMQGELPEDLPETEGLIYAVIGSEPIELDVIIAKTGMEPTTVCTALTMLQIKKRIIKCYGNSYQRL